MHSCCMRSRGCTGRGRRAKYDGEPHDDQPDVPGDPEGDHVLVDHLAETDARVEPLRHDIQRLVAHEEIQPDVGIRRQEPGEQRSAQEGLRGPGHVKPQGTAWLGAELPRSRDGDP